MEEILEYKCPQCEEFMYLVRSDTRYYFFVCPEDHEEIGEIVIPVLKKEFGKREDEE